MGITDRVFGVMQFVTGLAIGLMILCVILFAVGIGGILLG